MKIVIRMAGMLVGLAFGAAVSGVACGQDTAAIYPSKPVRWVVTFPPGASNDILARLFGQKLTEAWGQQFVVDNRPGAGGSIGAETVAKAAPDGYTLLLSNPGPSINNVLMRRNPPYSINDFAPVAFLGYAPLIIVAHPAFPPKHAKELIDYAKAHPGKVNWGSSGVGSSLHIGLALFQAATGVNVTHVPYKGAALALTDVVGGQINLMYTTTLSGEVHIKSGRVKVLGVADSKRQPVLPDVPSFAELGIKNADAKVWFGMSAPAKVPRPIIDKLNREVNKALVMTDVRQRLDQLGLVVGGGTPEEFGSFIRNEAGRLANLIKAGAISQE